MLVDKFTVQSPSVEYGEGYIASSYAYQYNEVDRTPEGSWTVEPKTVEYEFKTDTRVPKLGCAFPPGRLQPAAAGGWRACAAAGLARGLGVLGCGRGGAMWQPRLRGGAGS